MFDPKNHVIHLVDGCLAPKSSTTRGDVKRIVAQALQSEKPSGIVIHFHGGLVSESSALKAAQAGLYPLYADRSQAYPIFFVWESGFFEAPFNNLKEIVTEALFKEFVKKASEWALKKLPTGLGFKGGSGASVDEASLRADFDDWFAGKRNTPPEQLEAKPGADTRAVAKGASLDEQALEEEITESIEGDVDFQDAVQAVHNGLHQDGRLRPATRGAGTTVSATSLVNKEAAEQMFQLAPGATKGVGPISWMKVARIVADVVIRVIRRFRKGRAHGMYVTVVEETLRALYLDKIGRVGWWDRMKTDTADAFRDGQEHGGTALLTELKNQTEGMANPPKVTLVGHSTGAIYICNLLKAAAEQAPSVRFDVIFEAPAATHALLAETAAQHASRISGFRQFGMANEREEKDALVPILYTSSLLYFVSGLLESEPDEPLVGMARYLERQEVYNAEDFPNIEACRRFYSRYDNSLIWALSNRGEGLNSDAKSHGEFDDVDEDTMTSVKHILQHGF
jgi:hypothetical protein